MLTVQQTECGGTVASSTLLGDVFVVVIEDRRCDTIAEVWTDREAAIARAKAIAKDCCRHQDDYAEEAIGGWEFYARYSCESDSVRVVKARVQSPNDLSSTTEALGGNKCNQNSPPPFTEARGAANPVELIGAGICDACGEHVEQLMVMNQRGGRGVTAIAGLCSCQKCAGSSWPNDPSSTTAAEKRAD